MTKDGVHCAFCVLATGVVLAPEYGGQVGPGEPFNHFPGGADVLFLDGHVEFMHWEPGGEGEFPMSLGGFLFQKAIHMHSPGDPMAHDM